jgi:type I restriction enzyme M protein
MLDGETKSRINTARDILVGKVPDPKSQVEQITIALIYKFMDDMDVESEELGGKRTFFVGEYAKYAWRKIFDPRQSGYELLNLYSEAIDKMDINPGVPKLFRDIFKNAYLPYRDPETLKSFLKIINEFDYSHSEKLGDAFEYLLSVLGSQGDAGQFRTPRHIIDFMVEIVDPKKDETILDPACGTAGFLISSYKHIIRQNSSNYNPEEHNGISSNGDLSVADRIISTNGYAGDKLTADDRKVLAKNIHGYDISPDMVRLSLVNMYLHGIKDPKIFEYDTLTSEDNWHHFSDVILANPPFMSPKGGIRPHKRFSVQSNRSEVLFVDYIAEHLTSNGRAAVIVPEGIIFQSGKAYKQLRKMLVDDYMVGVISLPAGVFQPYSGVKTSILWLDKALAKKTDKILFIKIENDGFDLGAQRKAVKGSDLPGAINTLEEYKDCLEKGIECPIGIGKTTIVPKGIVASNGDYLLTRDRYIKQDVFHSGFPMLSLSDANCFTVESGGTPSSGVQEYWDGDITWITLVDLPPSDLITIIDKSERKITQEGLKNSSAKIVPPNSVIVSSRATIGRVGINTIPLATNQGFKNIIIKDQTRIHHKFLALMMTNLKDAMERLASGGTFKEISKSSFLTLQIPLPPLHLQEEIVEEVESYQKIIDGARQVVENYMPRIEIDPEWEMVELGKVCIELTDGSHFSPETTDSGYPYITVKDLTDGTIDFANSKRISQENYSTLVKSGCKPRMNDILFSKDGTVGKTALVKTDMDFVVLSSLAILTPDTKTILPEFLYHILSTDWFISKAIDNKTGVAIKRIVLKTLKTIMIPVPDFATQMRIVETISNETSLINSNKSLIKMYEQRIKSRIAKVWGE